jgi:type IV pilus assembly protein PilV
MAMALMKMIREPTLLAFDARGPRPSRLQRGAGLVEVLVAVIVLSIGLLGIAGMQLGSLRSNHSAWMRSEATLRAQDIMERMRANQPAALAGNYDIALGAAAPTGSTVRDLDLQEWKQDLSVLPAGDGAIARTVAGGRTRFTVTVQWDDSRGELAAQQFVAVGEL